MTEPCLRWRLYAFSAAVILVLLTVGTIAQTLQERSELIQSVNTGKIGIVVGGASGTYAHLSQDLVQVLNHNLNDKNQLRIIPMLGLGSVQNLIDLVYLKGVEAAMVQADVLRLLREHYIPKRHLDNDIAQEKINYIIKLYDEEIHLLAGSSITSIDDLDGMKVAVGLENSGSALSAKLIFKNSDINFEPVELAGGPAIEALKQDKVAAVFMVVGKPAKLFKALDPKPEDGLHFLNIQTPKVLEDTYREAELDHDDYPRLVPEERPVSTIAVSSVLAAYRFPCESKRFKQLDRFVKALSAAIPALQKVGSGYHQKWRQIDVKANVPGWERWPKDKECALDK